MSALGHSHRFRPEPTMSALTQITTKPATATTVEKGQTATYAVQRIADLFDHLVGRCKQRLWNIETERFSGFQVDHQLEFGGLLHWQIGGLCTLEDAASVIADLVIYLRKARSVAYESTNSRELASVV